MFWELYELCVLWNKRITINQYSHTHINSDIEKDWGKMILRLMLMMSFSSISGHPRIRTSLDFHSAHEEGSAEQACATVKGFEQSLKSALVDVPLCSDSKTKGRFLIQKLQYFNILFSGMYNCISTDSEEVSKWYRSWREVLTESHWEPIIKGQCLLLRRNLQVLWNVSLGWGASLCWASRAGGKTLFPRGYFPKLVWITSGS